MRVVPLVRCPVCGDGRSTPVPVGGAKVLERCRSCATVRAAEYADPDAVFVDDYFAGGPGEFGIDLSHPRFRAYLLEVGDQRMRAIEAAGGPRGGRLLDVGCGQGELLEAARARGWRVQGVEPMEAASEVARERGLDVVTAVLEDSGLPERAYDVVSAFHVLEHVPDAPAFLAELARRVRPEGLVVAESPNWDSVLRRATGAGWMHLRPLEHLVHLSPAGMRLALERAGLEPVAIRTPSHLARLHTLHEALEVLGRPGWEPRLARLAGPRAVPRRPLRAGLRALAALQDRLGVGMVVLGMGRAVSAR